MLLRLLATFILALGAAGIVILLNRYVFRGRLPRWTMPVVVAITIVGFQIFEEYTWYPRIKTQINSDYVVMQEIRPKQFWRPWSYIAPTVTNVTVVNKANMRALDEHPEYNIGMMTSLSYLGASSDYPFLFDCNQLRFGPYRKDIENVEWANLDSDASSEICVFYD